MTFDGSTINVDYSETGSAPTVSFIVGVVNPDSNASLDFYATVTSGDRTTVPISVIPISSTTSQITFTLDSALDNSSINLHIQAGHGSWIIAESDAFINPTGVVAPPQNPIAEPIPAITTDQTSDPVVIHLPDYFSDPVYATDQLSFSVVSNDNSAIVTAGYDQTTGDLTLTLLPGAIGTADITISAANPDRASTPLVITITVPDESITINGFCLSPDENFSFSDNLFDHVSDGPTAGSAALATIATINGVTFSPNVDTDSQSFNMDHGRLTVYSDGTLEFSPTDGLVGQDELLFTLRDGNGNATPMTIVCINVPAGQVSTDAIPDQNLTEGDTGNTISLADYFHDTRYDISKLTFTITSDSQDLLPDNYLINIDGATGELTFDLLASQYGDANLTIIAANPDGESTTATFVLHVAFVPQTPALSPIPLDYASDMAVDSLGNLWFDSSAPNLDELDLGFTVHANPLDAEHGNTIVYSVVSGDSDPSINSEPGVISWNISKPSEPTVYSVTVRATNKSPGTDVNDATLNPFVEQTYYVSIGVKIPDSNSGNGSGSGSGDGSSSSSDSGSGSGSGSGEGSSSSSDSGSGDGSGSGSGSGSDTASNDGYGGTLEWAPIARDDRFEIPVSEDTPGTIPLGNVLFNDAAHDGDIGSCEIHVAGASGANGDVVPANGFLDVSTANGTFRITSEGWVTYRPGNHDSIQDDSLTYLLSQTITESSGSSHVVNGNHATIIMDARHHELLYCVIDADAPSEAPGQDDEAKAIDAFVAKATKMNFIKKKLNETTHEYEIVTDAKDFGSGSSVDIYAATGRLGTEADSTIEFHTRAAFIVDPTHGTATRTKTDGSTEKGRWTIEIDTADLISDVHIARNIHRKKDGTIVHVPPKQQMETAIHEVKHFAKDREILKDLTGRFNGMKSLFDRRVKRRDWTAQNLDTQEKIAERLAHEINYFLNDHSSTVPPTGNDNLPPGWLTSCLSAEGDRQRLHLDHQAEKRLDVEDDGRIFPTQETYRDSIFKYMDANNTKSKDEIGFALDEAAKDYLVHHQYTGRNKDVIIDGFIKQISDKRDAQDVIAKEFFKADESSPPVNDAFDAYFVKRK